MNRANCFGWVNKIKYTRTQRVNNEIAQNYKIGRAEREREKGKSMRRVTDARGTKRYTNDNNP